MFEIFWVLAGRGMALSPVRHKPESRSFLRPKLDEDDHRTPLLWERGHLKVGGKDCSMKFQPDSVAPSSE